jgi:hypothetical protein
MSDKDQVIRIITDRITKRSKLTLDWSWVGPVIDQYGAELFAQALYTVAQEIQKPQQTG